MCDNFSRTQCLLDGPPLLGPKGEILKNGIPRWLENAILGLFLAGQKYFKSLLFLCQTMSLSFCPESVLPLQEKTKICNVWNMDLLCNGNGAKGSYWGF